MAKYEQVTLICDLDHGQEEAEGACTVSFSLDRDAYEIEACQRHADEIRAIFAPYAARARPGAVITPAPAPASVPARAGDSPRTKFLRECRAWSRAQYERSGGDPRYVVSDRGRIPERILSEYRTRRALSGTL
jgi:Lsr2